MSCRVVVSLDIFVVLLCVICLLVVFHFLIGWDF